MKVERIEEYNALRQEILQKDTQYNENKKSSYAVTTAVLAFALTQSEPFICLLPIVFIIPLYILSESNLRAILKIGAYIKVYFDNDGFYWERRNMVYYAMKNGKKQNREIFINNALIFISIISICCVLSAFKVFGNKFDMIEQAIRLAVIVIVYIISILIIKRYKVYNDTREDFEKIWNTIRKKEESKNTL